MKFGLSVFLIVLGTFIFIITFIDGRKRKAELTTSYVMHLKGYFGGLILFIIGLIILLKLVNF